jgi:hypothetical protein
MSALIEALGAVEAERFAVYLSRERFDYTSWRLTHLHMLFVAELSAQTSAWL